MIMARLGRPLRGLAADAEDGIGDAHSAAADQGDAGAGARPPAGAGTRRRAAFFRRIGERRGRVALLQGCAQQVLAPRINQAAINLLTRHGIEVVLVKDEQCCGALTHHLGRDGDALARARANITRVAKGSGTRRPRRHPGDDVGLRHRHQGLRFHAARGPRIRRPCSANIRAGKGYHRVSRRHRSRSHRASKATSPSPITPLVRCSTDRKSRTLPKELLSKNGFVVKDVPESHLCCGSAGTYNILQPDIASRLRDRKVANIATVKPDMIAAGNIGCMVQIAGGTSVPVVHTIELLDWATGGPRPGLKAQD